MNLINSTILFLSEIEEEEKDPFYISKKCCLCQNKNFIDALNGSYCELKIINKKEQFLCEKFHMKKYMKNKLQYIIFIFSEIFEYGIEI